MSSTAENIIPPERDSGLDDFVKDIQSLEAIVANWDEQHRNTVEALIRAHDELNKEAITRLIRVLKENAVASNLLREAVTDEIVYSVLRHHEIIKPSLHERIEGALDAVRPMLASHGGNVELVDLILPDTVEIRLLGACDGCPASSLTLSEGVEKAIKESCPEITNIKKAKGGVTTKPSGEAPIHFISPFARNEDSGWMFVCNIDEIPEANIKTMSIAGNDILLSRFDQKVTCYQNACAHLGMPLDLGEISNGTLICPHHGFVYSLESGECITAPEVQLQTHAVRTLGNKVEVKLL